MQCWHVSFDFKFVHPEEISLTSGPTASIFLATHLGRQEIGELLFTTEGRSEVGKFQLMEMEDQSKQISMD
jgi:hypothetical protein